MGWISWGALATMPSWSNELNFCLASVALNFFSWPRLIYFVGGWWSLVAQLSFSLSCAIFRCLDAEFSIKTNDLHFSEYFFIPSRALDHFSL